MRELSLNKSSAIGIINVCAQKKNEDKSHGNIPAKKTLFIYMRELMRSMIIIIRKT